MQTQFKDLKQGDIILYAGALFELDAPKLHAFDETVVYTIRAKFIECRRVDKIVSLFNRRTAINIEIENGLNLQGFANAELTVIESKRELQYG